MQIGLDLELGPSDVDVPAGPRLRRPHVRQSRVFKETSDSSFLPLDFRSFLPEGDASIWIRDGLERIDLSCLVESYADCGGIAYEPRAMLGILLYAYYEGEPGSRTIEKRCIRDLGYMHVGYGQKPDDRTIRRFRRRVGPALPEIFRLVVMACKEEGLLPLGRLAVDGTKIASAASQVKRWLTLSEKEDVAEMGLEPPDCSDPAARTVGASGKFILGYNCQAAVDCESGIVVAVGVSNVNSDGHLLSPMLEAAVLNAGDSPAEVVADAGYDTNEGANACSLRGSVAIIAPQSPVGTFWSVTSDDEIVCPMGNPAIDSGVFWGKGKPIQKLRVIGCQTCPFVLECCGRFKARELAFPVGCDPIERLNAVYRARSPEGRLAMRDRLASIEPIFGDLKWNKGLKRFTLRGQEGALIEWNLQHMARNLAKLGKALRLLDNCIIWLGQLLKIATDTPGRPAQGHLAEFAH